jgi:cytochrome c556
MDTKRILAAATAVAGLVLASGLVAAPKPEDAVKYRQGVLFAMGWNVGTMGAMVKGDIPFDAARFAFLAERTAQLSPMVREGFTPDSKGAKSHALPELWDNIDDFEKRMKDLNAATQALATTAKGGDEGKTKEQFGATVKVCKGCHDEYREEM